jgi:biotin carboxylase
LKTIYNLKSKRGLLIISGGILQVEALKTAKRLGIITYLVDGSEKCYAKKYADYFFKVSTKDHKAVAILALNLRKQGKIDGVYTQGADVEYTVAYAAKKAGLPGISPQAAINCNNKFLMRQKLKQFGIEKVKFAKAKNLSEFEIALKVVGFPSYVKPLDNSASRGVTRLTGVKNTKEAFEQAINACFLKKGVIVEEEIEGEEYSVDTILFQGKLYPAGISDRIFLKKEKYAVQIGSRTPSLLSEAIQTRMYDLMEKAAKAVGVKNGAFKGDLVVNKKGEVKIIEVTARTSGGFDSQFRKPYSFGIDLMKATIDIALGNRLDQIDLVPKWIKWSQTVSVFPNPGVVTNIEGVNKLKKIQGVRNIFILVKLGDKIPPYTHSATRNNFVIISADTIEDLKVLENKVLQTLKIKTTNG